MGLISSILLQPRNPRKLNPLKITRYNYGTCFRLTWRSESNRQVTDKLITEVKALNPDFQAYEIRGE